jgi:predicted aspartyl protease
VVKFLTLLVAALALLLGAGPARGDACRPLASFELRTDWYGGVYITVAAGGRNLNMLIDTGGTTSMLTSSTAASLGLRLQPLRGQRVTMYGGTTLGSFVWLNGMQIGTAASPPAMFLVVPDDKLPSELAGTLAPDFLSHYDVDFDFANARLNLLPPCPDRFRSPASLPAILDSTHHVFAPVQIDGKTIMAVLDTGASRSDISLETAEALFGFGSGSPGLRPAEGPDVEDGVFRYQFRSMSIGSVTVSRPDIVLVPDRISRRGSTMPRMVLGMSILRHYRLTIGYHEQILTVAGP